MVTTTPTTRQQKDITFLRSKVKGFKKININNLDIEYKKRYSNIYLIINNCTLFINVKNKVLGSCSEFNNSFWYSYLSSIEEKALNITSFKSYNDLIADIVKGVNND